jgi:hypothetical protein
MTNAWCIRLAAIMELDECFFRLTRKITASALEISPLQ